MLICNEIGSAKSEKIEDWSLSVSESVFYESSEV